MHIKNFVLRKRGHNVIKEFDVWGFWGKVEQAKSPEDYCNRLIEFKEITKDRRLSLEEIAVKLFLDHRAKLPPDPDSGDRTLRRRRLGNWNDLVGGLK